MNNTTREGSVKAAARTAYAIEVTAPNSIPLGAQPKRAARLAADGIRVRDEHSPPLIRATREPIEPSYRDLALVVRLRAAATVLRVANVVPDVLVEVLVLDNLGPEVAVLVADAILEDHWERRVEC